MPTIALEQFPHTNNTQRINLGISTNVECVGLDQCQIIRQNMNDILESQ